MGLFREFASFLAYILVGGTAIEDCSCFELGMRGKDCGGLVIKVFGGNGNQLFWTYGISIVCWFSCLFSSIGWTGGNRVGYCKFVFNFWLFRVCCTLFPALGFYPSWVFPGEVLMRHTL